MPAFRAIILTTFSNEGLHFLPFNNLMSLDHDIDNSAKWLNECFARINDKPLGNSTRNKVSAGLFHLALDHHGSIQLLISHEPHPHYGSAFALLRPQFEGYIRGVWFHCCASEQELEKFLNKCEPPKINELIKAIETVPGYKEGLLKLTKENTWKIMCEYSHGGFFQVVSRISATEIASNYTEEQVRDLISGACAITLNVSVAFAKLLNNDKMAKELLTAYESLFS